MPRADSLAISVLLTFLVAFGPISTDLYLPALPTLSRVFGAEVATVQLTLSVFLVGFALAQLVCGPLSDRFGRRPVLLGGLGLYVAGSVVCALAGSIEQLIAARLLQALGACCGPVLGRAVVRDIHGPEKAARMFAYMGMAMALAPAVGPILGGILVLWWSWRATFVLLAILGVLMLGVVWAFLAETNHRRDPEALRFGHLLANYRRLLGNPSYRGYTLCLAFTFSGMFAFISGSSFVLIDRVGVSPVAYGLDFGFVVLGYILGSFTSGRLTMRLGVDRMIAAGTVAINLAGALGFGLALAGFASVPSVVGPMMLFMYGGGLVLPNAMAGAIGPFPRMAGVASALLGFIQMLLAALFGAVIGHLHDQSPLPMMTGIFIAALATALCWRLAVVTSAADRRGLP